MKGGGRKKGIQMRVEIVTLFFLKVLIRKLLQLVATDQENKSKVRTKKQK
jgi:hypothetical protein